MVDARRRRGLGHVSLSRILGAAAVAHFAVPQVFDAIVPRWVPGPARRWTYLSGVAEGACALMLAVPATRRVGGAAAAGLLLAVYPANVEMTRTAWRRWRRQPDAAPRAVWLAGTILRLPLQVPLVTAALTAARGR